MSTPYNGGNNDHGNEPDGNGDDGFGDLSRYGATNHPEDQPGYGKSEPNYSSGYDSAYGTNGYSGAQFGGPGYSGQPENAAGYSNNLVQTNGQLQIFSAIGFGFKRTFSNGKLWLLGALAFLALSVVLGFIAGAFNAPVSTNGSMQIGTDIASNIVGLLTLLLMPFLYRLATHEVDTRATGWSSIGKDVHYWPAIAITVILWLISLVITFLFIDQTFNDFIAQVEAAGTDEQAVIDAVNENVGSLLGLSALLLFGTLLLTPLYQLMVWYAADGRAGFGQAIVQGFKAGASNYLRLLGFNVVMGIIMFFIIMATFGIGTIIALPVYLLAQAHAYRQIAGGPVPDDSIVRR